MTEPGTDDVGAHEDGPNLRESLDRVIDLDIDVDELWRLIATAEGWSQWLVDVADVVIEVGADGDIVDCEVVKRVHIDRIEAGRRINFTWWQDDDPSTASEVELHIGSQPFGPRRLQISERPIGITAACSAAGDVQEASLDRRLLWETRLWLLGSCLPATVCR